VGPDEPFDFRVGTAAADFEARHQQVSRALHRRECRALRWPGRRSRRITKPLAIARTARTSRRDNEAALRRRMNHRAANGAGQHNQSIFVSAAAAGVCLFWRRPSAQWIRMNPRTGSLPHMSAQSSHTAPGRFVVSTCFFTNSINNFFTPSAASVSGNSFDQMMQQVR
jgi:hypothetical protein